MIVKHPPIFTGYSVGSVIGSYTINVSGKQITLPSVEYTPDTYADLATITVSPTTGLSVTAVKNRVDSTNS